MAGDRDAQMCAMALVTLHPKAPVRMKALASAPAVRAPGALAAVCVDPPHSLTHRAGSPADRPHPLTPSAIAGNRPKSGNVATFGCHKFDTRPNSQPGSQPARADSAVPDFRARPKSSQTVLGRHGSAARPRTRKARDAGASSSPALGTTRSET